MNKALVVGIGSILRADDGIGIRAIEELERASELPQGVRLEAGDVSGLDLLKIFEGQKRVIIIDAADMKMQPGTIKILKPADIKEAVFNDKFSTHGLGLLETLTLADKLDIKADIDIVAIEPYDTSYGLELSQDMKNKMPDIIDAVKKLLKENR